MEEVLPRLIRHLKLHCKLLRYVSDKAKAFINHRDDQLLAGTNNIWIFYAGSNRDKNKWSFAITRGPLNFAVELSFNQTTTIDEVFDQIVYII